MIDPRRRHFLQLLACAGAGLALLGIKRLLIEKESQFALEPFPDIPMTENFGETARFDALPMADFVAGYDPAVRLFVDLYC